MQNGVRLAVGVTSLWGEGCQRMREGEVIWKVGGANLGGGMPYAGE